MLQQWLVLMDIMPGCPGCPLGWAQEWEGGSEKTWRHALLSDLIVSSHLLYVSPCSFGFMEMELWGAGNSWHGPERSQDWVMFGLPHLSWSLCSPHWELLARNLKNCNLHARHYLIKDHSKSSNENRSTGIASQHTASYRRAQTWSKEGSAHIQHLPVKQTHPHESINNCLQSIPLLLKLKDQASPLLQLAKVTLKTTSWGTLGPDSELQAQEKQLAILKINFLKAVLC